MIASGLVYGQFYPFPCVHCDTKSQGHEKEATVHLMVNSIQKNKEEVSKTNQLGLGNCLSDLPPHLSVYHPQNLIKASGTNVQYMSLGRTFHIQTIKNAKKINTLQIMYELY